MIGPKNEVEVVVNDEWVIALVDSGAQISVVFMAFVNHHNLPICQLQQLLDSEGFGGVDIPVPPGFEDDPTAVRTFDASGEEAGQL